MNDQPPGAGVQRGEPLEDVLSQDTGRVADNGGDVVERVAVLAAVDGVQGGDAVAQGLGGLVDRFGRVVVDVVRADRDGRLALGDVDAGGGDDQGSLVELHRTTYMADGTVVEFAVGVHAASRFAWLYDFKVPDSAATEGETK